MSFYDGRAIETKPTLIGSNAADARRSHMTERRSGERQVIAPPGVGLLRIIQDVEIVSLDAEQAVVVSQQTISAGERVRLEIAEHRGERPQAWLARAMSTRVVARDNLLHHETHLSLVRAPGDPAGIDPWTDPWFSSRAGAIVRRVPIQLLEFSRSGALWQCPSSVDEQVVGFIDVRASHERHSEAVRIVRAWRAAEQTWPYRLAVEFLTVVQPSPESLRGVAALMTVGAPSFHQP